jgi:two-component system NtrC family sensor kinase
VSTKLLQRAFNFLRGNFETWGLQMRRREFITRLGGAAVLAIAVWYLLKETHAQQSDLVRSLSSEILSLKAEATAATIRQFFKEIENQVGWTTQVPWSTGTIDQRKFDGSRVLRQVPAITELAQLDSAGKERLRQSKLTMNMIVSDIDFSHEAKFTEAIAKKVYYGPVYFRGKSEPYMTLALAGSRRDAGVSIAEVNLKLVWDLVMQMKVGEHGVAYIVDGEGRVVAHPDSSFQSDFTGLAQVQALLPGSRAQRVEVARDIRGRDVLTTSNSVGQPDWFVFVERPTAG